MRYAVWLPAILAFLAALFFIFFTNRIYFHSDSSYLQLWAEQVMHAKWPLSHDFVYAESRQVFNYHLFAIPWLLFSSPSLLGHSIASAIFCTLFFVSAIWAFRRIGMSAMASSLIIMLIFAAPSPLLADMFWGECAYGWESIFTILLIGFAFPRTNSQPSVGLLAVLRAYMGLFIVCVLFSVNGTRPVLIYLLPAIVGLVGSRILQKKDFQDHEQLKFVMAKAGTMLFGGLIGLGLLKLISQGISFPISNITTAYPYNNLKGILSMLPIQYLYINNGIPPEGVNINSVVGISSLCNAIFSVLLLLSAAYALSYCYKFQNISIQRIIILFVVTLVGVLYPFIFSLSNHENWLVVSRYLIPVVFITYILYGAVVDYFFREGKRAIAVILMLAALPAAGSGLFYLVNYSPARVAQNPHEMLLKELKKNGIFYGYATFWNASVITVRSSSIVKIRPVEIEGGTLKQFMFHSAYSWYDPQSFVGPTCLILTKAEDASINSDQVKNKSIINLLSTSKQRLSVHDFIVYIFDHNIANNIIPMKERIKERFSGQKWQGSDLPGLVGQVHGTDRVAQEGQDSEGYLSYGPYVSLPNPGIYRIALKYSNEVSAGKTESYCEVGNFSLVAGALQREKMQIGNNMIVIQDVKIPRENLKNLEVRVYFDGKGRLDLQQLEISEISIFSQ